MSSLQTIEEFDNHDDSILTIASLPASEVDVIADIFGWSHPYSPEETDLMYAEWKADEMRNALEILEMAELVGDMPGPRDVPSPAEMEELMDFDPSTYPGESIVEHLPLPEFASDELIAKYPGLAVQSSSTLEKIVADGCGLMDDGREAVLVAKSLLARRAEAVPRPSGFIPRVMPVDGRYMAFVEVPWSLKMVPVTEQRYRVESMAWTAAREGAERMRRRKTA